MTSFTSIPVSTHSMDSGLGNGKERRPKMRCSKCLFINDKENVEFVRDLVVSGSMIHECYLCGC